MICRQKTTEKAYAVAILALKQRYGEDTGGGRRGRDVDIATQESLPVNFQQSNLASLRCEVASATNQFVMGPSVLEAVVNNVSAAFSPRIE